MNYELAEQLKEAGFPQMPRSDARDVYFKGTKIPFGNIKLAQYENGQVIRYLDEVTIIPTLEELIAACGKPFMLMWFQEAGYNYQAFNDTDSVCSHSATGETAIEAVAKLWLALPR